MTPVELRKLIDDSYEMPYGAAQIATAERLINEADALGHAQLRFHARAAATQAFYFGGEPEKAIVTFAWCVNELDSNPRAQPAWHDETVRWQFKYIVTAMKHLPELSLDRIEAVLADMERRYRLGGHSLRAVAMARFEIADQIGDRPAAEDLLRRAAMEPPDENSDDTVWMATFQAAHLGDHGRDEEAIGLVGPALAGVTADDVENSPTQPEALLTMVMLPYLRCGAVNEARNAHLRGYGRLRRERDYLDYFGRHLEFCALTGNEARGLEITQTHLGWLDRSPSPWHSMEFSSGAALVLRWLSETGRGRLTVRRIKGDRAEEIPVTALYDELAGLAVELARRFDGRNRTAWQSERIARRLNATPCLDQLPLTGS